MKVKYVLRFKDNNSYKKSNMRRRDFDNIDDNKFVVLTNYFEQYAEGVTGTHTWCHIYSPLEGWDTREEAREFAKQEGLKNYRKKGREGYYREYDKEIFEVHTIKKKDIHKKQFNNAMEDYTLVEY